MREDRPSFTAQVVAMARVAMAAPGIDLIRPDPLAPALLHPSLELLSRGFGTPLSPLLWRALELAIGAMPHVGGRTLFFDAALDEALASGIEQIVLLGAGFDGRALRSAGSGSARYFELDHPATQAMKRSVVAEAGFDTDAITYCSCDFERESASAVLRDAGLDPQRPSFLLWEGVSMYLRPRDIRASVADFATIAAPGSMLCLDASRPVPPEQISHRTRIRRQIVARAGEPYRGRVMPEQMEAFLRESGWCPAERHDVAALYDRYFAGTRMQPPRISMTYVIRSLRA